MLIPIEWKQIAGYPAAAFCLKHDRLIEPIIMTGIAGIGEYACPYCAEEELPNGEARSRLLDFRPLGFYSSVKSVTFYCPHSTCMFQTISGTTLDMHIKHIHGTTQMTCQMDTCTRIAADFCGQCEAAFCKDHLTYTDLCVLCQSRWP